MNLATIIKQRLKENFSPCYCEVIDDSEKHRGHPGSQSGGKHFTIKITAACFENKSRIENHRAIYKIFDDLIPEKIHALRIIILDGSTPP